MIRNPDLSLTTPVTSVNKLTSSTYGDGEWPLEFFHARSDPELVLHSRDEGCAFLCGLPSGEMLFFGPKVSTLSFLESSCSTMAVGLIAVVTSDVLPIILVLQLAGKVNLTSQVLGRTHGG